MTKQAELAGMEDRRFADLEELAEKYAKLRDKRMAILKQEIELKAEVLKCMKKHMRDTYIYEGLEIIVQAGEESVKVRVHKEKESDEDGES